LDPSFESGVLVLGAGAAGLMCAIAAGQRGRRVTVLEHNPAAGRKILISGGGRCNFTNRYTRPADFISRNPHFAKSALARYTPADFVQLLEKHGIAYHEKTLGQLFCDRSAHDIAAMLLAECAAAEVRLVLDCAVRSVVQQPGASGFAVETAHGTFHAASLVVATGGLSIPKIGATPLGYRIAAQFGLEIVETRPALVPLALSGEDQRRWCDLAGVSTETVAAAGGHAFRERMLFTHRGLSGPAVLQASSYWRPGEPFTLDLLPEVDFARVLHERKARRDRAEAKTVLAEFLPKRLADRWFDLHAASRPVAAMADVEIEALDRGLHQLRFLPSGTEGYAKAEVTAGGIDTNELSSKTMESRRVQGLYCIGEVVDVTGHLGGFNFQWAWASGWCAGQYA
jgi:predicted Rossmann fold flavoprotein